MTTHADLIVFGTGGFAARIVFDIAATASRPITVAIAGRNIERLQWLKVAANARSAIFGRPATFATRMVELSQPDAAEDAISFYRPMAVVQAASTQTSSVINNQENAWRQLVAEGGLSATAVLQTLLSINVAQALKRAHPSAHFINCCFPDVVNSLIAARGLPVTCGVGNVAILSSVFAGQLGIRAAGRVKVLAPYRLLGPWRMPAATRKGPAPRVWLDDQEMTDVFARCAGVKLTPEPVIDISGASGVPLMLAIAAGENWVGHTPGPKGLPGGYPVAYRNGVLDLDLPAGLDRAEAIRWNARFEEENGMAVGRDGKVRYTGKLYEKLHKISPDLASGFDVKELDDAYRGMAELRARLERLPAR